MVKRLNPTNDFIFQKLFGDKEVKSILVSFLNAVLDLKDAKKLETLEIIENKELSSQLIEDKTARLDVRARTSDGTQLDIEVQLTNQKNMDKRTLFYWGKMFLEGIKKGDDYIKLAKVITINILNFNFLELNKFHSTFHLWEDEEDGYMLTDLVEIHMIELPKFRALREKRLKENPLQRWLAFLQNDISEGVLKELVDMDTEIKKAEERLEFLSSDPSTIELYKKREESMHERANMISSARQDGKEEGKIEGKIEGKVEVVRNMLAEGMNVELISKFTGLTHEEIANIKSEKTN